MSFKSELHNYLSNQSGITDLVSTRIYRTAAPKSATLPRITYYEIGADHVHHMTAASGMKRSTIQLDCWASTDSGVQALAEAVRAELDGLKAATWGDFTISSCWLQNELDLPGEPNDASATYTHRRMQTYEIWHSESVPTF